MTEKEAMFILMLSKSGVHYDRLTEALDMAIKALEQEPCENCISRQVVLELLQMKYSRKHLYKAVYELPPVTPQLKIGRWISFGTQGEIDGQIVRAFTCSKCGAISIFRVSNGNIVNGGLCPNCGAKMVEPYESEEV